MKKESEKHHNLAFLKFSPDTSTITNHISSQKIKTSAIDYIPILAMSSCYDSLLESMSSTRPPHPRILWKACLLGSRKLLTKLDAPLPH